MKYEVIIIGGGLSGLECACLLSRAGKSVLVLEQGSQAGGCIQTYRRGGMDFDTGFHYVGGLEEGQYLHRIFRFMNLTRLPWQRMDAYFDRVTIGGRTFALAQGYDAFVQTLASSFPDEREGLARYAALMKRIEEYPFDGWDPLGEELGFRPSLFETSAYGYLHENFRDPLLVDVLSGTSIKMELRKESLPLFTFVHGNSGFVQSSWRLKGGGSSLIDALVSDIRSQGGEMICNSAVEELEEKDGKLVCARCTDGRVYEGDYFISTIHPAETCRLVKRSSRMKKIYRTRISVQENTFGMFTVSLCIKPGMLPYFNWNHYIYRKPGVWAYPTGEGGIDRVLVCCRIPEDGSDCTRQVDLLTPMTWDACLPWEQTRVGRRGEAYGELKARLSAECIELAETCIPGLGEKVEKLYTSTPLTYRDYTLTPEGSAYGIRKDFNNPLNVMLSPRTPVPNLLLAGQSVVMHGMQGVTMTSVFVCSEIVGKDWINTHVLHE